MKFNKEEYILISACLVGVNCKWDGENNLREEILKFARKHPILLICPEQMGGLKTPRNPAEVVSTNPIQVVDNEGNSLTFQYTKGSEEVLRLVQLFSIKKAILKAKSPSCGNHQIYDGTFSHTLVDGEGVTAKLLREHGVEVINEIEYLEVTNQNKVEWDDNIHAS